LLAGGKKEYDSGQISRLAETYVQFPPVQMSYAKNGVADE